jgi:hypothetical protein
MSSFANYQTSMGEVAQSPRQQSLLSDMQARLEKNASRAEGQLKDAKYDAILSAGLAMMGGTSLADGIARAAQTGGATFLAGKQSANKAIDSAEQAELSFREYEMALDSRNQELADKKFNDFMENTIRLQKATGSSGSGAYDKALIRIQNDPFIKNKFAVLNSDTVSAEERQSAINDINARSMQIYEGFGVADMYQPYNETPAPVAAEEPGLFSRLFGSGNRTSPAEDPLSIR